MRNKKTKKIKIRKMWKEVDPTTKIISDKKNSYNRSKSKQDFKLHIKKIQESDEIINDDF